MTQGVCLVFIGAAASSESAGTRGALLGVSKERKDAGSRGWDERRWVQAENCQSSNTPISSLICMAGLAVLGGGRMSAFGRRSWALQPMEHFAAAAGARGLSVSVLSAASSQSCSSTATCSHQLSAQCAAYSSSEHVRT